MAPRALVLFALLSACGRAPPSSDGGCEPAALGTAPDAGHAHLPIGTSIDYATNPPAGGDHYPAWAVWGEHQSPVPAPYFVHNEEHGGIVLLYNCPHGCAEVIASLRAILNAQPPDPLCQQQGVSSRLLLTPDPDLDVPVAAASWGFTYKEPSLCVDVPSLAAFLSAHYGQGPESLCDQGQYQ